MTREMVYDNGKANANKLQIKTVNVLHRKR